MALTVRTIARDVGKTEGPVIRAGGEIVFVSMDRGFVYRIAEGRCDVLADAGDFPNGATEGIDGTLYVTQAGEPGASKGGIQTVARDGTLGWATRDPIAPNDLCFGPDGLLYCTDPTRPRPARDDGRLFRLDVSGNQAELLCTLPWYPNGLGFGLDNALYVANYGKQRIERFEWNAGGLGKPETFIQMKTGYPDGFCFDVEGNISIGANSSDDKPGAIQTYDRAGKLIDMFSPGTSTFYTNCALGADKVLIVTDMDGGAVLAVDGWPAAGLPMYPFRKQGA